MKIQTRPARYTVPGTLAAIALTAMSLSACGGLALSDGSHGSNTVNVCTLVPPSRVEEVTDEQVTRAIPKQLGSDPNSFLCTYYLYDGQYIRVEARISNSSDVFAADIRALTFNEVFYTARLPGVGNKAIEADDGVAALTDTDNILIIGNPGQSAWYIKLAKILITALG
jgi:hypothetical protein